MNPTLSDALRLKEQGRALILCTPGTKRALHAWADKKTTGLTEEQLEEGLKKTPNANLAMLTGAASGIDVLDKDTDEGQAKLDELMGDVFEGPIGYTPKGQHFHLEHTQGIGRLIRFIPGCDFLGDGGYVLVPPSIVNGKPYQWAPGMSLYDYAPARVTDLLKDFIIKYNNNTYRGATSGEDRAQQEQQSATFATLKFDDGSRDNDIFHTAFSLLKGGTTPDNVLVILRILASQCTPPFPEKEMMQKFESAMKRISARERNLTAEIREFISATSGIFSATELYKSATIATSEDKHKARTILSRLVKEGVIERYGNRDGVFRPVDRTIEFMDFASADIRNFVDLRLPLDLHKKTRIFPKGVIVAAGVSGMGKTLLALNAAADNRGRFPIFYFNSEMGPEALKKKLSHFPISIDEWACAMKVIDNWDFTNVADKIQPDAFNIVDYLEPEGEKSYNIHAVISAIVRRLNKGTALITVQKKPGATLGTGGIYSIKAATFALALDWGKIEISKNRFREEDPFPAQNKLNFEVKGGWQFVKCGPWYK